MFKAYHVGRFKMSLMVFYYLGRTQEYHELRTKSYEI